MKYQKALEVIEHDAAIKDRYINKYGETCAIGGLLSAAGYPVSTLWRTHLNSLHILTLIERRPEIGDLLYSHYGLTGDQLRSIQLCNDIGAPRYRHARIRAYIETLDRQDS